MQVNVTLFVLKVTVVATMQTLCHTIPEEHGKYIISLSRVSQMKENH